MPYFPKAYIKQYLLYLSIVSGLKYSNVYSKLWKLYEQTNDENSNKTEVCIVSSEIIYQSETWAFHFINQHEDDSKIACFASEIDAILKTYNISSFEDLLVVESLENIIRELKAIYERTFNENKKGKLNETSLSLLHYPLKEKTSTYVVVPTTLQIYQASFSKLNKCSGYKNTTLLTGDAMYNSKTQAVLLSALSNKKNSVLQVPHHGSYLNWQSVPLKKLSNKFIYYAIPTVYKTSQKVPKIAATIDDIEKIGVKPILITKLQEFSYVIK